MMVVSFLTPVTRWLLLLLPLPLILVYLPACYSSIVNDLP